MREAYLKDKDLGWIFECLEGGEEAAPWSRALGQSQGVKSYCRQWERLKLLEGRIYRRWESVNGRQISYQLIPPEGYREILMREAHTGLTGGHLGLRKSLEQIQRRAYWYEWRTEMERFCAKCDNCSRYWRGAPKRQAKLQVTEVGELWERIGIDLTGPHRMSRSGNVYILTVIDLFSKFAEAVPLRNKEAITVARALFDVILIRYGLPLQILSDLGSEFENSLMRELCRLMGIEKIHTTAYKPSTNGGIERFHRTLNGMLGKVVSESQRDWDERLPAVMAAYRASKHEATGFSPNYLMFGRENRAPLDLLYGDPQPEETQRESYDQYALDKVEKMRESYAVVRQHLGSSAMRMKKYYDMRVRPKEFEVGSWVFFYNPRRYRNRSPKWQKLYTGPFLIVRKIGAVNLVLQASKNSRSFVVHVDKVKAYLGEAPKGWLAVEEARPDVDGVQPAVAERQMERIPVTRKDPVLADLSSDEEDVSPEIVGDTKGRGRRAKKLPTRFHGYNMT